MDILLLCRNDTSRDEEHNRDRHINEKETGKKMKRGKKRDLNETNENETKRRGESKQRNRASCLEAIEEER